MTRLSKHLASGSAALLALSLTGIALASAHTERSSDEPISCEIRSTENRGMITLESLIHSDTAISGQYRFKVQSARQSGNSNISQGNNRQRCHIQLCGTHWRCHLNPRIFDLQASKGSTSAEPFLCPVWLNSWCFTFAGTREPNMNGGFQNGSFRALHGVIIETQPVGFEP